MRFDKAEQKAICDVLNEEGGSLWPYSLSSEGGYSGPVKKGFDLATDSFKSGTGQDDLFTVASSSGTASIHIALAGLGIPAGSEVIVPPMTDMGTITPLSLIHI